jgi:hypothetical protein
LKGVILASGTGSRFRVARHDVEAWQCFSLLKLATLKRIALVHPVSRFTVEKPQEANGIAG